MDAFKATEIKRMQLSGNKTWQDFFNANSTTSFDDLSIKERYDSEAGEEYKERLNAKCDDREFDPVAFKKERAAILEKQAAKNASRSQTPMGGSRTQSPAPPKFGNDPTQKAKNEEYFARMGNANATRPDGLPPSQGGKYGGFGSSVPEPQQQQAGLADVFQKDPVAALTKGFGSFWGAVSKQAKVVNESYIAPTAKNVSIDSFLTLDSMLTLAAGTNRFRSSSSERLSNSFERCRIRRQGCYRAIPEICRRTRQRCCSVCSKGWRKGRA